MRLCFMGTPEFAVPVLSELVASGHDVAAVYTQPPRPAGRGKKLRVSPVQKLAEGFGLPVRTPLNFKAQDDIDALQALELDVAIVVAYGLILPKVILQAPRFGCLNLHGSLLPRWRGAAPIHRAIMAGDTKTGIQVMQMETGLDTGPILLSEAIAITPADTTGSLHDRLSTIGAQLMPRALAALERGSLTPTAQAEDGITYAQKITSSEAAIDWYGPASKLDCHIRGLSPSPGAWFVLPTQDGDMVRVKCLFSEVGETINSQPKQPGTVLANEGALVVACGTGSAQETIRLDHLQKPGKAVQSAADFLRGTKVPVGAILQGAKTI